MRAGIALVLIVLVSPAAAAPRKVLVLPLDGSADAAVRAKLDVEIRQLAKSLDGTVTTGTTTFAETAGAVGGAPPAAACVDEVIGTLAVDELVWGIATTTDGKTRVVVRRATKQHKDAPRVPTGEATATVDSEGTLVALNPLFGLPSDPVVTPTAVTVSAPDAPEAPGDHHGRAIAMTAGGGFLLAIGLILWGNELSVQGDIDGHATRTLADLQDLAVLEERASRYAITGDLLVLGGLVLGGYGAWRLYQDHEQSVTVRAAPMQNGAGVVLEWRSR